MPLAAKPYLREVSIDPDAEFDTGQVLLDMSGDGLYMLDEPEAALSPKRRLAALSLIDQRVPRGAQFIIATDSPILLAYPNAKILCLDDSGIAVNHYQRRLQQLLADEE
jgi:predicted ATPase